MTLSTAVAGLSRARTGRGTGLPRIADGAGVAPVRSDALLGGGPAGVAPAVPRLPTPGPTRTAGDLALTCRPVGAHREPGSNPWRTGVREVVAFLTFGRLVLWRPSR